MKNIIIKETTKDPNIKEAKKVQKFCKIFMVICLLGIIIGLIDFFRPDGNSTSFYSLIVSGIPLLIFGAVENTITKYIKKAQENN